MVRSQEGDQGEGGLPVWGFLPGSEGANESKAHRGLPALRPGS